MDEIIRRSLGNESLEEILCILVKPKIQAGEEPEGYSLSYILPLKSFFCFNLRKQRCSEALHFKVGFSLSFSNLDLSEMIFSISLS